MSIIVPKDYLVRLNVEAENSDIDTVELLLYIYSHFDFRLEGENFLFKSFAHIVLRLFYYW